MTLPHWCDELRRFDWNELADTDAIGHWPASVRASLLALLFGIGLGVAYGLLLYGTQSALRQAEAEHFTLHVELQTKSVLAAELAVERMRTDEAQAAFLAQQRRLSMRAALPALLDLLAAAARHSGLELDELGLHEEIVHEFHVERPLSLVLRGDYHALGVFADAVAALPQLVTLRDFSVERTQQAGVLRIALEASTYRAAVEDASIVTARIAGAAPGLIYRAAALRSPFAEARQVAAPTETRARDALEAFDLTQLTMIGSLEREGRRWALIRDANGTVTRVGLGARLGRDQGRIVRITRERVDLIERVADDSGWRERNNGLVLPGVAAPANSTQGAQ